ncbi:flagellar biosynthetic protein FliR [bacterium]|nr:flagellar biosynthetic protein FliR [bacterium]
MSMPFGIASIEQFVLVFIRITAALSVMPIFRHRAVPSMLKAGLGLSLAFLVAPNLGGSLEGTPGTPASYLVLALGETLVGLMMGFAAQFVFYAVEMCGRIIGLQSGLSFVATVDPNTEVQSDLITQVYEILTILIFLSLDGHLMMIRAIHESFSVIPIGGFSVDGRLAEWSIAQAGQVLGRGVQLAAPMMATLLVTDISLGILTRVAPTMNVFVLGFPLKIGLTLIFTSLTMTTVATIFSAQYGEFIREFPSVLRLLTAP